VGLPLRAPSATVAASGTILDAGAVRVEASQRWTDTGLAVKEGDRVASRTTGQIRFAQDAGTTAGPDGNDAVRCADFPVTVMPAGSLIGKVSAPFPIGSKAQPIVMPADGRRMLGVNDNDWSNNTGFFSVVVTRQQQCEAARRRSLSLSSCARLHTGGRQNRR